MHRATEKNDSFYKRLVEEFYAESRRRHPRFPLVEQFSVGVAVCRLPESFDEYFVRIEASARRNVKKARRLGYDFHPIEYNDYLADVTAIRRSAEVRQGELPAEFLTKEATLCRNPPTKNLLHDYRYYGVLKDGTLYAYAGCFVCGEVCLLEHIYGHAERQSDGVVPLLITGIAEELMARHPAVRYYCYGTYFGAGTTMRRFKRKFLFQPHRVEWSMD
jgi:hypothetical protein